MSKDILSEYQNTTRGCNGHNNHTKSSLTSLDSRASNFKKLLDNSNFKDLLEQLESMKKFAINFKETKLCSAKSVLLETEKNKTNETKIDEINKQEEISSSFVEKTNLTSNQKNKNTSEINIL